MVTVEWIILILLLFWGYLAALVAVLLVLLQKERRMLYTLLSGLGLVKREQRRPVPIGDRIGELRKKWRDPLRNEKGEEGDR